MVAACGALLATVSACSPAAQEQGTVTTHAVPPGSSAPQTTQPPDDSVLYLNLMWHQHQPRYPLDVDGNVSRPWVRVHATKDYWDMAALLSEYPDVHATFNLTPGLLLQLEELADGTKDAYWAVAEIPSADLTDEQRRFVLQRFFDTNGRVVARFPRYQELAGKRAAAGGEDAPVDVFDDAEYRDLQVLFNLAWTDPSLLAASPLDSLVEKGRDFAESDKAILFEEQLRIIRDVIPLHARMWESGQIEVTTTPLAHPILPLIADTDLATVGDAAAVLPDARFRQVQDADLQVQYGLETAERLLGRRPTGMWPGEGSVAELIMWLFSKNGVRWVASGEEVLAGSIGLGSFSRSADDTVQDADLLYRPRLADVTNRDPVAMFFRDGLLSDLVGFEYSAVPAEAAADDFMRRLEAIRAELAAQGASDRPHVVSVILDGENAWEHYENDGIDFLRALYERLSDSDTIETTTPSEYLDRFGEPEIVSEVFPGAWFQPNFATWIGEQEEATAWDYLARVRDDLRLAIGSGVHSTAQVDAAMRSMLFAEGSDWFWWFGADQDSGQDGYFDGAFRELLGGVYDGLGLARPALIGVPIIPKAPVVADAFPSELLSVAIDGIVGDEEWRTAGRYEGGDGQIARLSFGYDTANLFIRIDFGTSGPGPVELYVGSPGMERTRGTTLDGAVLGHSAGALVLWAPDDGDAACVLTGLPEVGDEDRLGECRMDAAGFDGTSVELAVPLDDIGPVEAGDGVLFSAISPDGSRLPGDGPGLAAVPDISNVEAFLEVIDPAEDDHGPGTYVYPTDAVFDERSFDLTYFEAGTEGDDIVFTFEIGTAIGNPWGSPNGLALQTLDIYVDVDPGAGTGARVLLPGRNAALEEGNGWEYGITVEGWEPAVYVASVGGTTTETKPSFRVAVLGDRGKAIVRIPRSVFGEGDPSTWGYAAAILSQEGFPSPGVRRVRDVGPFAEQWIAGGATDGDNHTRIFDLAWPDVGVQEILLSDYPPLRGSADDFGPDDLPQVPLLLR